ncbi:MAG: DNA cytosine methyltransferase, partial [Mycoplasma sp.]|nr:DNA cytosine methyltransferase [Mycoplasma sp.]
IKDIDLITYSFPCQGLSNANMSGSLGIDNEESTSHLIYQIKRILVSSKKNNKKLPKYLLMENVPAFITKKHINSFHKWINTLEKIGYKSFHLIIHADRLGSIQKRKRLVLISILKDLFPKKLKNKHPDDLHYLFYKNYEKYLDKNKRKQMYYQIFSSSNQEEIQSSIVNNTKSRQKMIKKCSDLINDAKKRNYYLQTLTTRQDRIPNIGLIPLDKEIEGKLSKRLITYREAFLIMGFTNKDIDKLKPFIDNKILTISSLYRQAGNSIVVPALEKVFMFIKDIEKGNYG